MNGLLPAYLPQSYSLQWVTLGESFQHILARLRRQRGLSQSRLAQLAQVSVATTHRAEDVNAKVPSVRISIALFRALNSTAKVGVIDALAYAKAAGIDNKILDPTGALDSLIAAGDKLNSIAPMIQRWNDAIDALPSEWREPTRRVASLVDSIGEERTLAILKLAAIATGASQQQSEAAIDA